MSHPLPCAAALALAMLLGACGNEAPVPKPTPVQPTALERETAEAVAQIPSAGTDEPIRLRVDREDNLAVYGFHGAREFKYGMDPQWHYWGHFSSVRSPQERLHVLTAVLRAEAARRPRQPDGLSEATLEVQAERDVRCGSALRVVLLAAADEHVRITRFWFRTDDQDDEGARLQLVAQRAGPGGGTRPPTVTADARSAGLGRPDVVFLLGDRDHRFSNTHASTVEGTRESLARAFERWRGLRGDAASSSRRFSVYVRGSEPPLAWTVVRLLWAAEDLGFGSLQWEVSPLGK